MSPPLLKDYQANAVAAVVEAIRKGADQFQLTRECTAVSLSAPTGAGKTVIATTALERLLYGGDGIEPNSRLTVLWVTDDPSLNEQTKRKMEAASSQLKPGQPVTVGPELDQEVLDPKKIYFVHIQQLGKGATRYVQAGGDRGRRWPLWETISNTVNLRGADFLLVIDEAHRGTTAKRNGEKTIVARLIDGMGTLPRAPVVLGISATPDRFIAAMAKDERRTLKQVGVRPEQVRESGLIKDKIRISHPATAQPGDSTLLELAVNDLRSFDELWRKYAAEQEEPPVSPVLVIQVRPKTSDADIKVILDTLGSTWAALDGNAIGHSFQEHATLNLGPRSLRYIAPQDIQDDPGIRAVLFKEALTTGWDCPRAEVMVSLRPARDHTYIAQLIGRMVRTPLARRVATNDVLNTVALYLPYFDEEQVAQVISSIRSDENQIASQIELDPVICTRNSTVSPRVWDHIESLPTYTRPARCHRTEVARLNSLAVLLAGSGLDHDATIQARKHTIAALDREHSRLGGALARRIQSDRELEYLTHNVDLLTGQTSKQVARATLNARNIEDRFRRAKRILGDAAAKWYWEYLCDLGESPDHAKIHVAALAADSSVLAALEAAAKSLIDSWRATYNSSINSLPDATRAKFYEVWQQSRDPQQITLIMPNQITAPGDGELKLRHLYADANGLFPVQLPSSWERRVLEAELAKPTVRAWYRNPTGGTAALGVSYGQPGSYRTLYPDFLFFHEIGGQVVADIIDPHRPNTSDTAPKWAGLAHYATAHGHLFRRIEAVIGRSDGTLLSVDLKNPEAGKTLARATNEAAVRRVFESLGGPYQ
jgi:type III restriction enzyme